jgi:hypothetical protein
LSLLNFNVKLAVTDRASEIIITLFIFCFASLCFHQVTDDYAFYMSSLAARQYSDFAYFDVHFQGFIGIREVYKFLYYLLPRINWHYIFMIAYQVTSLYLVLRALRFVVLKNIKSNVLIRIVQIFFALFYIDNIAFVSHTRVSLIFCGIALFNLAFTKVLSHKKFFFNGLLFIFGMLLRPESSLGMLCMVGLGFFTYTFDLVGLFKRIWIPILATAVFLLIFTIDLTHTDLYIRRVEPEIEYKMMAKMLVDLSQMKTAKDSVKYEAATVGMWFDMKEITPEFMRNMILAGSELSIRHTKEVLVHIVSFYAYYPFIPAVIIALLILVFSFLPDRGIRIIKIILFQLCVACIIYGLDCNGFLVSYRHFMSLQFIALIISCFYFFDAPVFRFGRNKSITVLLVFCILTAGIMQTMSNYVRENIATDHKVTEMVQTMNKFEQKYTNRIVAISIDSRFLFDQHFSLTNKTYQKNTYIMFDWFTFPLTPRYIDYMSRKCQCDYNDPVALFKWFSDNKVIYIASPYRYNLLKRYMKIVHGCDVNFDKKEKINDLCNIQNEETDRDQITIIRLGTN